MTPYDVGCYNTERRYYHRIISSLPGLSTNLHAIVILKTAHPSADGKSSVTNSH